jgi:tetratricopeptide (TPR) repeat protein
MADLGELASALVLRDYFVKANERAGNENDLATSLLNRGSAHAAMSHSREARADYERSLALAISNDIADVAAACLLNAGHLVYREGDSDGAMTLYVEAERVFRLLGDAHGIELAIAGQAAIYADRALDRKATELYQRADVIARARGDERSLALGRIDGSLVTADEDLNAALQAAENGIRLFTDLGDKHSLAGAFGNKGVALRRLGRPNEAEAALKRQYLLATELADDIGVATSLVNLANVHRSQGDVQRAFRELEEAEILCRRRGQPEGLALALANRAELMTEVGSSIAALAIMEEAADIARRYQLVHLYKKFLPLLGRLQLAQLADTDS